MRFMRAREGVIATLMNVNGASVYVNDCYYRISSCLLSFSTSGKLWRMTGFTYSEKYENL